MQEKGERAARRKTAMAEIKTLEEKDLVVYKKTANQIQKQVVDLKINSQEAIKESNDVLDRILKGKKVLKERKEEATKPLNQALKVIRGWFEPLESALLSAEQVVKQKQLEYKKSLEVKVEAKKEEIIAKVESGRLDFDKASQKIEKVEQKLEGFNTRKVKKWRVVNEDKIPDQYWQLNESLIRADAILAGKPIEGIEVYDEEIIVGGRS